MARYLAQHSATGRPAKALAQAVEKPQGREDGDSGGPGENHIDASHHAQANREEPAGADLVWKHATDELTDSIGQRLTAGDHAWTNGGQEKRSLHRADKTSSKIFLVRNISGTQLIYNAY